MMTLRERKTHYGIVVTSRPTTPPETVNAAAIKAFAPLPPHMKRTLTWDQGVEMARHRELPPPPVSTSTSRGSSPWQRGANENYTACRGSTSPRAPICPCIPARTSAR